MTRPISLRDPKSFDHLPARYDRISALLGGELRAWVQFHLPTRGGRAADLGCGTGSLTELLGARFAEVLAVDLSAPMLEHARRHHGRGTIDYRQRDLRDVTPATDGRFDLVLATGVLHALRSPEPALYAIRSLLAPGGRALLADPVDERPAAGAGERAPQSRSQLRRQAWRTVGADLAHRRRPVREGLELLRLQLDPDWLDHRGAQHLLPAADWESRCRAVFPGASIVPLQGMRALAWPA